jgi:hypothetical protein
MSGNTWGIIPARQDIAIAPKHGCSMVGFDVAGAYAACLDLNQYLILVDSRNSDFFKPIIMRAVAHDGMHLGWDVFRSFHV